MNKYIIPVFALSIIMALVAIGCKQAPNDEQWKDVEHCLVWGVGIDRESLMVSCVDFANQTLKCSWQVQSNLDLVVWTKEDYSDAISYPCTKKVMARQLVQNATALLESEN